MSAKQQMEEMENAIYDGDCAAIDALIANGLDVNARTEGDESNLLHLALVPVAFPPIPEVVQHLIDIGVDVNARECDLWTPLHFAVRTKNTQVLEMLLSAGAEVDAETNEGITPLHESLLRLPVDEAVVEVLLSAGADPDRPRQGATVRQYVEACAFPNREAVLALFDKYADMRRQ
jgi:ankyrin repeat protein